MGQFIEKKHYRIFICVNTILCFFVGLGAARAVNLAIEIFSLPYQVDNLIVAAFCGIEFGFIGGLVYLVRTVRQD